MNINVTSQSGKKFSKQEMRVITETIIGLKPFFLREFTTSESFPKFIEEMEKLEIFEWVEDKKKMRYSYTGDILVEIDLLPLFRDYQIEQILKK
jgi:hypothetical protein